MTISAPVSLFSDILNYLRLYAPALRGCTSPFLKIPQIQEFQHVSAPSRDCSRGGTTQPNKNIFQGQPILRIMLQTAGLRLSEYCAEITWQPCTVASWWRNHVPCRLAYRRVDCRAIAAAAGRSVSPRRYDESSGTPSAFMTGRSGGGSSAISARTSSSAPSSIILSKRPSQAAYRASRGGSTTMGRNRRPVGGPADGSDCHAVIERPVASRTSAARSRRWVSPGFRRAAVVGSRSASS